MRAEGIGGSVIEGIGWLKTYIDGPRDALPEQDGVRDQTQRPWISFMLTLKRRSAVKGT